jgi:putative transposase
VTARRVGLGCVALVLAACTIGRVESTPFEGPAPSAILVLPPVSMREGLASEPAQWLWSSARAHAEGLDTRASWLQHHPDYWQCGNTPFGRQASYREHLNTGNTFAQDQAIEAALKGQWGLGGAEFLADLSVEAGRRAQPGLRGRPKREAGSAKKPL